MLSVSRKIATRRLVSFLASAKVTVSNISMFRSDTTSMLTQNITTIKSEFPRCEIPNKYVSFALLASERILNAMMSWTIVTQVQAEAQAASTMISDSAVKKTESIIATCCHNQCEDQGGWDGLIFTLGMQGTLR